jgi:hypothetical protein
MKHTIFRLTFAAALTLGTAIVWQTAQPASANEYICTDRNSGDWFTTDRDQSSNRGNITCRERDSSSDRQDRDRNSSDWNYSNRDNSDWDNSDRDSSDRSYSDNNDSRDDYARGYEDACAHTAPTSYANSRGYAEGYRDGLQRCDRPQRWNRNAAH